MEDIKIHLTIIQRVVFLVLKIAYWIQIAISEIFWKVIGNPMVYFAWKIYGEENEGFRTIFFYKDDKSQSLISFLVKYVIKINSLLNGIQGQYTFYEFLLKWNPSIPLIALDAKAANYSIYWLDSESKERKGAYGVNSSTLLGQSVSKGSFLIVGKKFEDNNPSRVCIECLWLSGGNAGEKFTVSTFIYSKDRDNESIPHNIYFPPRLIVIIFEVFLFISAITAFTSILYHVWKYLINSNVFTAMI